MILNSHRPWKPAADDRWLTVVSGHLWLTADDGHDHVLGPGQTLELRGRKGWLAQALGHCACEFTTSQTRLSGDCSVHAPVVHLNHGGTNASLSSDLAGVDRRRASSPDSAVSVDL